MNCKDAQNLMHGYLDGELDLVRSVDMEAHMEMCAECSRLHRQQRSLRAAIQASPLYQRAPADLRRRIQGRLGELEHGPWRVSLRWLALVVSLAIVALVLRRLTWLSPPPRDDQIARLVVAGHVRSLLPNRLLDVESADQHTVKPWFAGKLDFSPLVKNLAADGFPLAGARVDYLDDRSVAALVYRRGQHWINLFVWPQGGGAERESETTRLGYCVVHWTSAGMTCWAVSDLNRGEMDAFRKLILGP